MARKRVNPYPRAGDLQRTFETKAKLGGARRFLAGEGIVVFAYEKEGVGQVVADTWLPPSAYRRMAQHLDMTGGPTIAGYRLSRRPSRGAVLDIGPATAFDDFRQQAERLAGVEIDAKRRATLRGNCETDGTFRWEGQLAHDGFYDLVGGERIVSEQCTRMVARAAPDDTVDLAVTISGPDDLTVTQQWLARACPATSGWTIEPVGLTDAGSVIEAVRVIAALGEDEWTVLGISYLDAFRVGAVEIDGDRFTSSTRRARYDVEPVEMSVISDKLTRDGASVAGLTVFVQRKSRRNGKVEPIISLRLNQPRSRAVLQVSWESGRMPPKEGLPGKLTKARWDELVHVDWDRRTKERFVSRAWARSSGALLDDGAELVPLADPLAG